MTLTHCQMLLKQYNFTVKKHGSKIDAILDYVAKVYTLYFVNAYISLIFAHFIRSMETWQRNVANLDASSDCAAKSVYFVNAYNSLIFAHFIRSMETWPRNVVNVVATSDCVVKSICAPYVVRLFVRVKNARARIY